MTDDKGPVLKFEWFSGVKEAGGHEEGGFPSIFSNTRSSTWTGAKAQQRTGGECRRDVFLSR